MCGIVGIWDFKEKINPIVFKKMRDSLAHRGPDDKGVFLDSKENIGLGQRRLSIVDLTKAGHQPMKIDSNVIVYNGEVYNFIEIRKKLEERGHKFFSNSDTEVILRSYLEWGIEAVNFFRGMFAFAIWDSKKRKLYLFRDRFGVKPIYYYFDGKVFIFASELKAIYQFPYFRKEIDFRALSFYFQLGYIPAPYTIFKNTFKLEAGHILEIDKKFNLNKIKYWDPHLYFLKEKNKKPENEIIKDLEDLLVESFQYRMVADVEVGIFLSGGIDSSLVAAILQKNSLKKIKTFTVGFKEKDYDEAPIAKKISQILGTEHYEYYLSVKDLENIFQKYVEIFDEPFGDSSGLPTYLLAKFAREKVKVVLSGDGGDELFLGYDKYRAIEIIKDLTPFLRTIGRIFFDKLGSEKTEKLYSTLSKFLPLPKISNLREKTSKLINVFKGKNISEFFQLSNSYWLKEELKELFKNEFYNTDLSQFYLKENLDFREQMQLWDIKNYLADDILVKTDRTTMAVSLEAREPYLDQKILEYLAQIPPEIKFKERKSKYLLCQILYKYLPKELFKRPKTGFLSPIYEWLKSAGRVYLRKYLDISTIKKEGIFNPIFINQMINKYNKGNYFNPDKLWLLIVFEMWREKWFNNKIINK